MDTGRLGRLLQLTFDLWGVSAEVHSDCAGDRLRVQAADGTSAWVERAALDSGFRWHVRWRASESERTGERSRPCGSLAGVLAALRRALGVDRGSAIRIAPPSEKGSGPFYEANCAQLSGSQEKRSDSVFKEPQKGPDPFLADRRVPVTVLTGFLGSGKTTLLARLLRHPDMGRTAVIVNEFGEVPLDHDLIETSDESFVQLSTGCLCCRVRSDLVLTLTDLAARRRGGVLPAFERVVIETSGLADAGPILHALMTDRALAELYRPDCVVTTVDGIAGIDTLARYPESVRQAVLADTLVITKTDLPYAQADALAARLRTLNPEARLMPIVRGAIEPAALFAGSVAFPSSRTAPTAAHDHTEGIAAHCLVRSQPLHAATLALFVSALADNCGPDLLRMKGLVRIAEEPGRPAAVHGVQHVYYPLEWLPGWPSGDERSRMVFIGRGLAREWIEGLLEMLEAEVADTLAARGLVA